MFARFPNGGSPFGLAFQSGDITGFEVVFCMNAARTVLGRRARWLKRLAFKLCGAIEVVLAFLYFCGRRMPLDGNLVCLLRKI